jgi:hypothetical protein
MCISSPRPSHLIASRVKTSDCPEDMSERQSFHSLIQSSPLIYVLTIQDHTNWQRRYDGLFQWIILSIYWEDNIPEALKLFWKNRIYIATPIYFTELWYFRHLRSMNHHNNSGSNTCVEVLSSMFDSWWKYEAFNVIIKSGIGQKRWFRLNAELFSMDMDFVDIDEEITQAIGETTFWDCSDSNDGYLIGCRHADHFKQSAPTSHRYQGISKVTDVSDVQFENECLHTTLTDART